MQKIGNFGPFIFTNSNGIQKMYASFWLNPNTLTNDKKKLESILGVNFNPPKFGKYFFPLPTAVKNLKCKMAQIHRQWH